MRLNELTSVINSSLGAKDRERAFTFIEFIKEYGEANEDKTFITLYKEYLNEWANIQQANVQLTREEYVRQRMLDILKSITLTYSSYEEQQYIASIDWSDPEQVKTLIPLYVRKIREICEFYRKKRNETPLIIRKNSMKGSYRSIEEIIYTTIVDFIFNNRHLQPQMAELKQNLLVSIEQYVDTYSEYFDVPRDKNLRIEKEREYMIEANMNDIDYRDYIEINEVINEVLFSGEVYLEDIGLIADLAMDLTQECAGEMLELKNELIASATVNQIPLTEQINLRRRFYEKFLGCDLYYMYVDANKNITIDLLCTAKNPSGNLLNTDTADRAVTQNEELELLSHIGLFFKPDKTSILKVNAKDFTWSVDESKLEEDKVYVFPDPSKYGNIGNNKNPDYPLIMEYKMDYDIRSLSSGAEADDPLILIDEQAWNSYYSKQQDIFKVVDNKNYEYSFTSLANLGFIHNYQVDSYNNEFALYKGYTEVWVTDPETGEQKLDHVEVPDKFNPGPVTPDEEDEHKSRTLAVLFNGGYFEDPFYPGRRRTDDDGTIHYEPGRPFDYDKKLTLNEYYHWSGIKLGIPPLVTPDALYDGLNFGEFGSTRTVDYTDHFEYIETTIDSVEGHDDVIDDLAPDFYSQLETDEEEKDGSKTPRTESVDKSFVDLEGAEGTLFIRNNASLDLRPLSLSHCFTWLPSELSQKKIITFYVKKNVLIYKTADEIVFAPYAYEEGQIINNLGVNKLLVVSLKDILVSDILWVEKEQVFYLTIFNQYVTATNKSTLIPMIYKFDPVAYSFTKVVSAWDMIPVCAAEIAKIDLLYHFDTDKYEAVQEKIKSFLTNNTAEIDATFFSSDNNFENFNYPYFESPDFGRIIFSYNNNLGLFLLAYLLTDNNGIGHLYEHRFKINSTELFNRLLVTNVYSIIDENTTTSVYNEKLLTGKTSSPDGKYFFRKI